MEMASFLSILSKTKDIVLAQGHHCNGFSHRGRPAALEPGNTPVAWCGGRPARASRGLGEDRPVKSEIFLLLRVLPVLGNKIQPIFIGVSQPPEL